MLLADFRKTIRNGQFIGHTSGYYTEYAQANVVILEKSAGDDFADFCAKNTTPCPLIYAGRPGEYNLTKLGDIDIRTDIPAYNLFQKGRFSEELNDITRYWQDNFVCFCIGCSFTFDKTLSNQGIRLLHVEQNKNVAMYKSNIPLNPSKLFKGEMIVSMRWIEENQVENAVRISSEYPDFHGKPVHIGEPEKIGIFAIDKPDYGDFVIPESNQIPVFWGCGVTPQNCLAEAKLPIVISHKPGSMLITDLTHLEIMNLKSKQLTQGDTL